MTNKYLTTDFDILLVKTVRIRKKKTFRIFTSHFVTACYAFDSSYGFESEASTDRESCMNEKALYRNRYAGGSGYLQQ